MDLFRDLLGLLRRGRLAAVVRFAHPRLATLEVGAALGANADELDLHALGLERSDARLSLLDRRRVVGPAEPAVAGDADETDLLAQNSSIFIKFLNHVTFHVFNFGESVKISSFKVAKMCHKL